MELIFSLGQAEKRATIRIFLWTEDKDEIDFDGFVRLLSS